MEPKLEKAPLIRIKAYADRLAAAAHIALYAYSEEDLEAAPTMQRLLRAVQAYERAAADMGRGPLRITRTPARRAVNG